MAVRYWDSLKS
jgi:hypothetical protein